MNERELTRAILHAIQTIDLGPGAMVSEQEYRMATALMEAAQWRYDERWASALEAALKPMARAQR